MRTLDLGGVLCWCLMSLAFVGTRSRVRWFNVICGILLFLVLLLVLRATLSREPTVRGADAIALIAGLVLYWSGLLICRAMLSRSVSLHLLLCYSSGQTEPAIDDRIADRLDDALNYRLVRRQADLYVLSRFGTVLDFLLTPLYRVMGTR
jgi:hypothetical protein